jgi:hypothetical protein
MTNRVRMMFLSGALAAAAAPHLGAQKVELFGRFKLANITPEQDYSSFRMSGWNTSATYYPTHRLGLTADFAGYYGTAQVPASIAPGQPDVDVRQYSFMGGPQIRLIHTKMFDTSVKALIGAAHGYVPDATTLDETKIAALVGSNIDLKVTRHVALRFSPGLYITKFGPDQTQKSFSFSVGPVFRFGGNE